MYPRYNIYHYLAGSGPDHDKSRPDDVKFLGSFCANLYTLVHMVTYHTSPYIFDDVSVRW